MMALRDDIQAQNVPLDFSPDDPEVFRKLEEFAKLIWLQLNEARERLGIMEEKVNE